MSDLDKRDFPPCPVCGQDGWRPVHNGPVRDGTYGRAVDAIVARCDGCGVERLAESASLSSEAYRAATYREHLGQDHDISKHYASHDDLARFTLDAIWPLSLRGKVVADIGCGGGSLLDHIRGLPDRLIAIDPAEGFAASLRERGYEWHATADAATDLQGGVDVAFSIQVIEHVDDPLGFLADIRRLLKDDGICVVSTPNRDDIMMELLPDDFPSFFYRTQHRWAFDRLSLEACARRAGFSPEVRYVHRYGMANSLQWLRDRKPAGRIGMPVIDATADGLWRTWLESTGRADNLYAILRSA